MPKDVTVTFDDGSTHTYKNAPDNLTPDQVEARATSDYGKKVTSLSRGGSAPTQGADLLRSISDNFTAPIKQAYQGLQDVNARNQALNDTVQHRSLQDKLLNAPRDMAMGLKNTIDQGLAVGNVAVSPLAGAVNTVAKPVGDTVSNALYDNGVNAYAPGGQLNSAPLSRDAAAQQLTGTLATALSLGAPESGLKGAVTRTVTPKAAKPSRPAIPSVDDLRAAKTAAYQQADSVGAVYHPTAVDSMLDSLHNDLMAKRLNPKLAPTSAGLLEEAQSLRGQPASFNDIEQMRQLVGDSVGPTASPREKMYAGMIKDHLSEFLNNAQPTDMLAGDPAAQATAINQARSANVAYRKAEAINNALDKADLQAASTGSGGNIDNATRQKLRSLYQDKKMNWTPNEKMAFESAIRGGKAQNLLRLVGKLSPEGNGLMLAGHIAAAVPTGGMSAVPAIAGAGAKAASEAMTRNSVQNLLREVTGANPLPAPAQTPVQVPIAQPNGLFSALGASGVSRFAPPPAYSLFGQAAATEEQKRQRKK